MTQPPPRSPVGLIWDATNYSCPYDAIFTVLNNIWFDNPAIWSIMFSQLGGILGNLSTHLSGVMQGRISIEQARNEVRRQLHDIEPTDFPYGHNFGSVDAIVAQLFPKDRYGVGKQSCPVCGYTDPVRFAVFQAAIIAGLNSQKEYPQPVKIKDWLAVNLSRGRNPCPSCRANNVRTRLVMSSVIREIPPIMVVYISHARLSLDTELVLPCAGNVVKLKLRGIIYSGQNHFTCRIVDVTGQMWFHDGITSGRSCLDEGRLCDVPDIMALHKCGQKNILALVYARELV
ncbi:hypothetical protein C8R44DRAFT_629909 [Mycena epipterygia]|nr:hypothetical protein C8R44DRAFT_629909 [Mycena epipterygia]